MSKQPAKKDKQTPLFILLLGVICLLLLSSLNLHLFLKQDRVLGTASKTQPFNEISFWEDFLSVNDDYLDGWVELAKLKAEAGKIKEVKEILIKIEEINPNSQKLLELKNSL
jgi:hypothetical protein